MEKGHFIKAGILSALLVILFLVFLEYYWRSKGLIISYNDDKVMWADQRRKVDRLENPGTVFSGGSRIKFDLDVAMWKEETGEDPIQLAIVGTPARLVIFDLAEDKDFRGNVIIDVAEGQFFYPPNPRREKMAKETLQYFHDQTPAQRASAQLNFALESKLVLLEESRLGLNGLLEEVRIRNRKGVVSMPTQAFENGMVITNAGRQNLITARFLRDTMAQRLQSDYWMKGGAANMVRNRPPKGDSLLQVFKLYSAAIEKIRTRGGKVIFVRPPSSGAFLERERKAFPGPNTGINCLYKLKHPEFILLIILYLLVCNVRSYRTFHRPTRKFLQGNWYEYLKKNMVGNFRNNLKPAL
ncbi:hypothetical protein [Ferruginibacter sp.]